MIIKFTGLYDDKIGTHDAKRIEGINVKDNQKWDRKIFANNKDLRKAIDDIGIGEYMEVVMEKSGKYWNVAEIKAASGDLVEAAKGANNSKGSTGGKSTWGGRTGEAYDRSAAIYLAFDFLKWNKDLEAKKTDKIIGLGDVFNVADAINDYIHDGINPTLEVQEKSLDDIVKEIE